VLKRVFLTISAEKFQQLIIWLIFRFNRTVKLSAGAMLCAHRKQRVLAASTNRSTADDHISYRQGMK